MMTLRPNSEPCDCGCHHNDEAMENQINALKGDNEELRVRLSQAQAVLDRIGRGLIDIGKAAR